MRFVQVILDDEGSREGERWRAEKPGICAVLNGVSSYSGERRNEQSELSKVERPLTAILSLALLRTLLIEDWTDQALQGDYS
jgi:hypothetical protein